MIKKGLPMLSASKPRAHEMIEWDGCVEASGHFYKPSNKTILLNKQKNEKEIYKKIVNIMPFAGNNFQQFLKEMSPKVENPMPKKKFAIAGG